MLPLANFEVIPLIVTCGSAALYASRSAGVVEPLRDDRGGPLLGPRELRVGVDVAPKRGDLGSVGEDRFDDLHGRLLRGQFTRGTVSTGGYAIVSR